MKKTNIRSLMSEAMAQRSFVRLSRRFEETPVRGYVIALGRKFFALALVSDRLWFDGFECFRVADVQHLEPDPYAAFATSALKKRGERRPRKPRLDMDSVGALLLSAQRAFPLVTIHCEETDPAVCHIGRVVQVSPRKASLLEIRPDATWEEAATDFQLREITRVNFGGDYEDALRLVGGDGGARSNQSAQRRPPAGAAMR